MNSLTVIVITKNEALNIEACLRSVLAADQIVVLDSGSSDRTRELAASLGAEVHQSQDWAGFGPQKNRALVRARCSWVLSLDADERVSPALMAEIIEAIQSNRADGYSMPRVTQFCDQWIKHCGWAPDRVLRLFRRKHAVFSDDFVHEKLLLIDPRSAVGKLREPLLHYSYPTPEHYWSKLQRYSHDWALQKKEEGRKASISRAGLSAAVAFLRSYIFRLGFLDGAMGFVVCVLQAQAAFGKYFELYWLNRQDEK